MLSLAFRTFEFLVYHLLIVVVDRVSRLPRASTPPELMRPAVSFAGVHPGRR